MAEAAVSNSPFLHREVEEAQETGYESLVQKTLDGDNSLSVLVEGVTCALCIQKIETALSAQGDIRVARLNFGARRLLIEWCGAVSRASDFVRIVEHLGYGVQFYDEKAAKEHQKSEERFLLLCLGVAGFAMGNVMLLSVGVWSTSAETMGMATRDFLHWIAAFIALPAVLFSGRPFFRSALKVLSKGHTNMDVPISLALILARDPVCLKRLIMESMFILIPRLCSLFSY